MTDRFLPFLFPVKGQVIGIDRKTSFINEFELQQKADSALQEMWLNDILFTWQWWLLAVLFIVPWFIWWKVVDRERIFNILSYGLMVMLVSMSLDAIGVEYDLWEYHYQLFPLQDILIVYDFSVITVAYMLIYQYKRLWKPFVLSHIALSGLFAFAAEPALVFLGYYQLLEWKYIYSFPLYFAVAVALRWLMIYIEKIAITSKP